jgi:hypothetical protein
MWRFSVKPPKPEKAAYPYLAAKLIETGIQAIDVYLHIE